MKYYTLLIALLVIGTNSHGQITLTTLFLGENNSPVRYATVKLHSLPDSLLIGSSLTDSLGKCSFYKLKGGAYYLAVSALGYKDSVAALSLEGAESVKSLVFQLATDAKVLKEVTVQQKKQIITNRAGKVTVDIEQSKLAQSQSAFELLKNLPGVTVSKQGEIKLKGRSGVQVMIDGEPVKIGDNQLKALLSAMPSNSLQSIEVLDHPPVSMDAAGSGGVINIVFKRKPRKGLNGSVSSGIGWGRYFKTDHSATINYGNSKWNFNSVFSYGYDHTWTSDSSYREMQGGLKMQQISNAQNINKSYLAQIAVDRYFNDKNTISFQLSYTRAPAPGHGLSESRFITSGATDSILKQFSTSGSLVSNWESTVRYKHIFTDKKSFILSFSGTHLSARTLDKFFLYAHSPSDTGNYENIYPSKTMDFSLKGDYTNLLFYHGKKIGKMEAGFKSNIAEMSNRQLVLFYGVVPPEISSNKPLRNRFRESISALYGSVELNPDKWELRGGLRTEYTYVKGHSISDSVTAVKQSYLSFFPNLYIGYKVGDNYKIGLGYSRRIERPDFEQLNPAVKILDAFTLEGGNPLLKPQLSSTIELEQQLYGIINLTTGVNLIKDPLFFTLLQEDGARQSKYTTLNIGKQQEWYANLSLPLPLADWWENYYGAYFNFNSFNTTLAGKKFEQRITSFGMYAQNSFTIPGDLSLEVNGWVDLGGSYGNMRYKPMGELNVGINKDLFGKKLNVGVSLSDVFYTNRFKSEVLSDKESIYRVNSRYESRIAKLTLSWHFGRKSAGGSKISPSDASEEKSPLPDKMDRKNRILHH